jgi:hypothetical protein
MTTEFARSAPLAGIVAFLAKLCGQNVHDAGIVTVTETGSHVNRGDMWSTARPKNAANFKSDEIFRSDEHGTQWLCYDFHKLKVRLTHYTIKTHSASALTGCNNPQNWVIEGSNDEHKWVEFDRQENNQFLNSFSVVKVFRLASSEPVQMIRLRQTGPNHAGNNELVAEAFEVFGSLLE